MKKRKRIGRVPGLTHREPTWSDFHSTEYSYSMRSLRIQRVDVEAFARAFKLVDEVAADILVKARFPGDEIWSKYHWGSKEKRKKVAAEVIEVWKPVLKTEVTNYFKHKER